MSDYWYWRLIPCKETGSCNCFATTDQSNEEKEEDTNHRVVVSDIMQLVRDKQEVPETTAGKAAAANKVQQKIRCLGLTAAKETCPKGEVSRVTISMPLLLRFLRSVDVAVESVTLKEDKGEKAFRAQKV
ncbi:hypothetical protein Q9966_011765 [Columba livia]|nr:hypothetical protein Q9966_011765 [Columba livia]